MTHTRADEPPIAELLELVIGGRTGDAHVLVQGLVRDGWRVERLVTDLLAVVQRRVGEQWQAGDRTIAQEHAVTAAVDELLGALGRLVPLPRSRATVALVCAEGEWHVTPARMAALLLRSAGWRTRFLGGSTPPTHLARTFTHERPSFVAVSCTDPRFLLGAGQVAEVARQLDIPTLAGGAAFGQGDERARQLGITGWAPDVSSAATLLDSWLDDPPSPATEPVHRGRDATRREHRQDRVIDQAIQRLASTTPGILHHGARPLDAVRRDLGDLLHMAHVAAVCADDTLFDGFVDWLADLHPPRGLPHDAVRHSVRILRDLTDRFEDGSRDVLAHHAA